MPDLPCFSAFQTENDRGFPNILGPCRRKSSKMPQSGKSNGVSAAPRQKAQIWILS
jgi:hypothetical protein